MALTAAQLRKWRTHPYAIDVHLALLKPTVVFRALVNTASATYPTASIPFDNVTVGAYTDIAPGMVVRIGSSAGIEDYGRQYVRAAATATEIPVGWTSRGRRDGEIDLVDNAVIEVLDMRVIYAKIPRIDAESGVVTKDYNVGYPEWMPPVANAGPDYAQFVDGSNEISVYFDGSPSFVTQDGTTIVAYDWTFPGGTPSTYSGVTPGNVVFGEGSRHISLKVTDSNDRQHTAYALVHGATKGGSYDTVKNFQIVDHVRRAEGTTVRIRIDEELLATDYPAGTRVLIWCTERYGRKTALTGTLTSGNAVVTGIASTAALYVGMPITGTGIQAGATILSVDSATQITMTHTATATGANTLYFKPDEASIAGPTGRQHMLFSGYIADEDHILEFQRYGLRRSMTITCIDAAGRLDQLVGFSLELQKEDPDAVSWSQLNTLDIGRAIHYILQWHSNALDLADFIWAGTDYPHPVLGIDGASLYKMCNDRAEAIAHRFCCDAWGRLCVVKDINITPYADRPSGETVDLLDSDWSSMSWTFKKSPRTHWLRGASMLISTSNADEYTPSTSFVKSPGLAPGQGSNDASTNYQLCKTLEEHREREGHRYAAKQNAVYGYYSVTLAHGGEAGIDPASGEWVRLRLSNANRSLRGDTYPSGLRFLPVEIQYKYNHRLGSRVATVVLEREVIGTPAVDDPQPPEEPAPFGDWSGSGWTMDQYLPILDLGMVGGLPPLDFGAEQAYDPPAFEGDAQAGTIGGRMIALCRNTANASEWRVARIKWTGGTQSHDDISPSETIRAAVGDAIRIVHDPYDYKRVLIKGTGGVCMTNNVAATSPTWEYKTQAVIMGFSAGVNTITFESGGATYKVNTGSVSAPGYNSLYSLQSADVGGNQTIDVEVTFSEPKTVTGGMSMLLYSDFNNAFAVPHATLYDGSNNVLESRNFDRGLAVGWNTASAGVFNSTGVRKIKWTISSNWVSARFDTISFTLSDGDDIPETGSVFCDFQPLFVRNGFAWLSQTPAWVYFNITLDAFKTVKSSKVAPYDANMVCGFASNPHNWRQIYVVAGDPDPAISSGVYESTDGGAVFTKIATVTHRAGPIWWNWSTDTANTRNRLRENLCFIYGKDGSNNIKFRRVGAANAVTIVTDANRYPGGPLALGMNSRDLDYGFYVAQTGHFYKTSDKGATWDYTAQVSGTLARGWWQYPKDKNFAVVFGDGMLSYTTDAGANFTDCWSTFSSWADGQYGSGIIDDIVNVIIDLTQAFTTAVV